jgi:glucosamine--fructose-6-phosphate aminotransferase (isomerizing)
MASSSPSRSFDPDRPLPPPPDPWRASGMPPLRAVPPFLMTEMIEAEPALARRLVESAALAEAVGRIAHVVRDIVSTGGPIVLTGCGTSEHAAIAVADQLAEALFEAGLPADLVRSEQAFELALEPPRRGLVIGVSHEGGSAATNRALEAARGAGARTALVTGAATSPAASFAESGLVAATNEIDQSWCHTVAYVSAIVVGALVAARIAGREVDPEAVARLLGQALEETGAAETAAAAVARADRVVVIGSGADRPAGRELVLKLEEGAALPAAYRDLETFLHGHLAGVDERDGLVAIVVDARHARERAARARQLLTAAREVGMPAVGILSEAASAVIPVELTPAGRVAVAEAPDLLRSTAALLATAVPLQLLTERTSRVRGRNPDAIRRDEPKYLRAAEAVEG